MTPPTAAADQTSLFGPVSQPLSGVRREIIVVRVDQIAVDPQQPREEAEPGLVGSMKAEGFWPDRPITLRAHPDTTAKQPFMIIDGERRWLSAQVAGFETVYAVVLGKVGAHTDAGKRLIMQLARNRGSEPLTPLEEANALMNAKLSTGATLAQLEEATGIPKTTISDRLALAEAPDAFKALFADEEIGASAAPIVRRFKDVPSDILTKAVEAVRVDFRWTQHAEKGEAVPNAVVQDLLEAQILTVQSREIPEYLVLLYGQSPQFEFDGKHYATSLADFHRAQRDADNAAKGPPSETARDKAKGQSAQSNLLDDDEGDSMPSSSRRAATPARPAPSASERKRQEKEDKQRREQADLVLAIDKASPAILDAIALAVTKASAGASSPIVRYLGELLGQVGVSLDGADVTKRLRRGSTAEDVIRFFVGASLVQDWSYQGNRHRFPAILKQLGLNVDLKAIVERAKAQATPLSGAAARSKANKEKGGKAKAKPAPKGKATKKPAKKR